MRPVTPLTHGVAALALMTIPGASAQDEVTGVKREVVATYADIAYRTYSDALAKAKALGKALDQLVAEPTQLNLILARSRWIEARLPYLQSEVFRFYGGPIDDENGPEALLNGWPLDEAYIDYVKGNPDAGIINHPETYPTITKELLASLNEKDGERNISAGYHAIEFLLWGQDANPAGPGGRRFTDYTKEGKNSKRRAAYMIAAKDLLVGHLHGLVDAWRPDTPGNYRSKFLALPLDTALQNILTGVAMLAGYEVAGKRLTLAYETREQEDEHSCFSDTTHLDLLHDTAGIANILAGAYVGTNGKMKVKGTGIIALAEKVDPPQAAKLRSAVNLAVQKTNAIKSPFDQAILGENDAAGRKSVKDAIDALNTLTREVALFAKTLGLRIRISDK